MDAGFADAIVGRRCRSKELDRGLALDEGSHRVDLDFDVELLESHDRE